MSQSVLLVVTHLLGVGHLTRMAAIGRGLEAAGHRVTLVSGGRAAPLVATGGVTFVQLPPVHCRGVDFSTLLGEDGAPIDDATRRARIELLVDTLSTTAPDILVTETFPFGRRQLGPEFRALLEAAASRPRPPAVLASVRDILNPPAKAERGPEAEEVLGRFYDGVLVHGDEGLAPLSASWPVSRALANRLVYTGYIVDRRESAEQPAPFESGEILVSGGGSAASLPLFRAAIHAARLALVPHPWRILVGHGVSQGDFDALAASAGPARVERARRDFPELLASAAVSVSQAGYNTVVDLALARARAVLVPFEQGKEAEQRLRAEQLATRGFAEVVGEAELDGPRLGRAVAVALSRPRPQAIAFSVDGVEATVRAVEDAGRFRQRRLAARSRLDAALAAAAGEGRVVDVWWRDDDAYAPSAALDRLLALARRFDVPVALAVIPARVEPALAQRLADEPLATVIVHGYSHDNHAPEGAKRRELGDRPIDIVMDELSQGLARLGGLFGARCLPVLAPPWNRIDPALLPRLHAAGFRGLTTFGARPARATHGLALANAHWDPIDWHGHRGLADQASLLDGIARFVEERRDEPLGLLTHHLAHDAWIWGALERLLSLFASSSVVRYRSAAKIFLGPVTPLSESHIKVERSSATE